MTDSEAPLFNTHLKGSEIDGDLERLHNEDNLFLMSTMNLGDESVDVQGESDWLQGIAVGHGKIPHAAEYDTFGGTNKTQLLPCFIFLLNKLLS